MQFETIAVIALILCGGAALQSAAGFGFGMFAVPLLILAGRPSGEAIVMVATVLMSFIAMRRLARIDVAGVLRTWLNEAEEVAR